MKMVVPAAPLNRFVEVIWVMPRGPRGSPPELALPTGTVELVVDLDEDRIAVFGHDNLHRSISFTGPILCGVHTKPFAIDNSRSGKTLGVHFKPGGACALLPIAMHEMDNQLVSLESVIGTRASELRDALDVVAQDDDRLCEVTQRILCSWLHRDLHPVIRHALARIERDQMRPDVQTLVSDSGYSHRRFNELFRISVGLGAKQFSRVTRFQHALRVVERQTSDNPADVDWADVVAECNFYDQAHLIHEFRHHATLSPSAYMAQRGERLNHPLVGE